MAQLVRRQNCSLDVSVNPGRRRGAGASVHCLRIPNPPASLLGRTHPPPPPRSVGILQSYSTAPLPLLPVIHPERCARTHTHTHTHTHRCIHTNIHICKYIHKYMYTKKIHKNTYIHTNANTYTHTHIYIYTNTYTQHTQSHIIHIAHTDDTYIINTDNIKYTHEYIHTSTHTPKDAHSSSIWFLVNSKHNPVVFP